MGSVIIRSSKDFANIFRSKIAMALKMTQDDVYKTVQEYMTSYYMEQVFSEGSSVPDMYNRTYRLLKSLIKTDIKINGNSVLCTVEIDQNYLNFSYEGGATGQQVMGWLNSAWHGGSVRGKHEYWNEALMELSSEQGIIWLMKYNLKKCGVPIQ